jgi:phospholipid transport system substrate-binding protein
VKTFPILFPAFLALVFFLPGAIASSQKEAEAFLKKSVDEIVGAAKKSKSSADLSERVRPILTRTISFPDMTRLAIGPGWREFSEAERDQAIALYTTLIIRTYSARFTPGELPSIDFRTIRPTASGRVEALTTTLYQGGRYDVVYHMRDIPQKGWRVTDVVIEGVSMVANYRAQFDSQFKSGGSAAVLQSLKKAVDSRK